MADSLQEIFAKIPERFDAEAWGDQDAVLQFDVTGDEGGQWYIAVKGGALSVTEGRADSPDMTLTTSAEDLKAIMDGELNAVSAFMQGRLQVDGDMSLAMKLQSLLGL